MALCTILSISPEDKQFLMSPPMTSSPSVFPVLTFAMLPCFVSAVRYVLLLSPTCDVTLLVIGLSLFTLPGLVNTVIGGLSPPFFGLAASERAD
jgi:hypothetical protein